VSTSFRSVVAVRNRADHKKRGSECWKGSRSQNHPNGVRDLWYVSFIVVIMQGESSYGLGPLFLVTLLPRDLLTIPLIDDDDLFCLSVWERDQDQD
jgi:hypothetical protein